MKHYVRLACFAGGVLFGSAGVKLLTSKDARKAYTHITAAGPAGEGQCDGDCHIRSGERRRYTGFRQGHQRGSGRQGGGEPGGGPGGLKIEEETEGGREIFPFSIVRRDLL